jgi:NADPH2:quinone reductase
VKCHGLHAAQLQSAGASVLQRSAADVDLGNARVRLTVDLAEPKEANVTTRRSAEGHRRESAELARYIVQNWFKPGRRWMVPYSIQWMMRLKPAWFRQDLLTLLDLLKQGEIKPVITRRLPLEDARRAHEMLGEGGVLGKIVLLPNG